MKSGLSQSKIAPREGPGVNYCFFGQTCAFLDKLSDKQRAICALMSTRPSVMGPGDVKSPRVMSRRRAHASVRGRRRGRHTMMSEGTVSLSRYAWFVG